MTQKIVSQAASPAGLLVNWAFPPCRKRDLNLIRSPNPSASSNSLKPTEQAESGLATSSKATLTKQEQTAIQAARQQQKNPDRMDLCAAEQSRAAASRQPQISSTSSRNSAPFMGRSRNWQAIGPRRVEVRMRIVDEVAGEEGQDEFEGWGFPDCGNGTAPQGAQLRRGERGFDRRLNGLEPVAGAKGGLDGRFLTPPP